MIDVTHNLNDLGKPVIMQTVANSNGRINCFSFCYVCRGWQHIKDIVEIFKKHNLT